MTPNRLATQTSPYLLQHANNPVDWYPWGEEALERARLEDKPIFLSIGYAACHWCHVMERESFENPAIATFLNEHFVSIKVDREERPDLDDIYMAATVALSGSGGWPMTVFLAPDRRPFFAGTYFPPDDRWGRPGFHNLLQRIAELWKRQREAVLQQAEELTEHVRSQSLPPPPAAVDASALARGVAELDKSFDARWGGFGRAPKFPPHQALGLLFRFHRRTGDPRALELALRTLDGMKNGGIYDHVAGGFARYSTDERWLVPHFEKMLYDNAQLAVAYLDAFQISGDAEYGRVVRETLDYVMREMQGAEGGYYSATDADSEGEEGKFFVFSREQIAEILEADEADAFCLYYDVTPEGNWEGKSILHTPRPLADVAAELGRDPETLREALGRSREKVYAARLERVPPLLDDKIVTAWNGLMIGAMAEGHRVLRDPRYLASARRAAHFAMQHLRRPDGGLFRTARDGHAHIEAFLEDYAYLADGVLSLYETSGERAFLDFALELAERALADFGADGGAFHFTAESAEPQIARPREGHDGALPNPNAVLARALARLAVHADRPALRERAAAAITAYGRSMERLPRAFATALAVLDFLLEPPTELVIAGAPGSADTEALLAVVAERYIPNRVVAVADPEQPNDSPLTREKAVVNGRATLYICRNFACQSPLTDPDAARAALAAETAPTPPDGRLAPP